MTGTLNTYWRCQIINLMMQQVRTAKSKILSNFFSERDGILKSSEIRKVRKNKYTGKR